MRTPLMQGSALNAKFDLCFKFKLVSIADFFQDLGERELSCSAVDGDVPFLANSNLADFKEVLQMRLDELEEAFKEKADVDSSLEEFKKRMSPAEQMLLENWLADLYDEDGAAASKSRSYAEDGAAASKSRTAIDRASSVDSTI